MLVGLLEVGCGVWGVASRRRQKREVDGNGVKKWDCTIVVNKGKETRKNKVKEV